MQKSKKIRNKSLNFYKTLTPEETLYMQLQTQINDLQSELLLSDDFGKRKTKKLEFLLEVLKTAAELQTETGLKKNTLHQAFQSVIQHYKNTQLDDYKIVCKGVISNRTQNIIKQAKDRLQQIKLSAKETTSTSKIPMRQR